MVRSWILGRQPSELHFLSHFLSQSIYRARKSAPSGRPPWDQWDRNTWMGFNGEKVIIFRSQSLYALDYAYVVVKFNHNFLEFDRLLCNCSVKGCREITMRKITCLVYDVTLPATGVDHRHNWNSPRAPIYVMIFISFDSVILPLEKSGEVEQRDPHVCTRVVVTYIICVESSGEL
jgi:hypothetical protein